MKKLALLFVCLFCLASASLAAPAAPQMSYSLNGTNITVDWSHVPDATAYTLYYAVYPYHEGDTIYSMDNGNKTTFSINLWDGAAYYIAASAGNSQGNSSYSNIEYFIIKDHEFSEWDDKATLGSARTRFAGGVIDDKIYSFGGYDDNGLLINSLEIYDPAFDSWSYGTANTKSVADVSGAVVNKRLYVFGATGNNCGTTPFAEKYDPGTTQWTALTTKSTQTSGAPAVAYNGKVYLFGGWQQGSCDETGKVLKKTVEAYNPSTNSWQTVTNMPKALEGATVAVYDDKAYVIGGVDDQGHYATDIIAYDFTANTWIESGLGTLNTPRMFPANSSAPVIEDTILLVGGWVDSAARSANADRIESNVVEIYSPRTRTVALGKPLPEATAGHLPAAIGGELFVVGGMANDKATEKSWKADITIENASQGVDLQIDSDSDGFTLSEDCNDNNPSIHPGAEEICEDGVDQDCSGDDSICQSSSSIYEIVYQMLRKNSYPEGMSGNPYRGYVQLTKNGQVITPEDFTNAVVRDSKGEIVPAAQAPDVYVNQGIKADCTSTQCSWGPYSESGITFYFDYFVFPIDSYTFTIDMVDEQLVTIIPVDENISIPGIDSQNMQASWQGEDLELNWNNPTNEPNWGRVNKLRIYLYGTDSYCGTIKLDSSYQTVLLPKEMLNDMGCGTPYQWSMQTRVEPNDSQNMQIARGYSFSSAIQPP